MPLCPCCSHQLIRQISRQRLYWFCSPCHQEMPNFSQLNWVGKTPTSVFNEFEKQSPQETYLSDSLDTSHQLYKSFKPDLAFCPVEPLLAANV